MKRVLDKLDDMLWELREIRRREADYDSIYRTSVILLLGLITAMLFVLTFYVF
jgi:hypothetical protein